MKVFHQTGFRYKWNITSIKDDGAGDGLILSPLNIAYKKLNKIPPSILQNSMFDPQIYLINDNRGDLSTYPYHPQNINEDFCTDDLDEGCYKIAELCVDVQTETGSSYIIIPTRYHENYPSNFFENQLKYFTNPIVNYCNEKNINKKLIQTVFIKDEILKDKEKANDLLNQLTSINDISGFYIIFEYSSSTKQLKDLNSIIMSLKILNILKLNGFEIHIGYTNTESVLFTLLDPDSLTIGSYENLRSFNIKRFETQKEKKKQYGPNARLYSAKLFQFIEYSYISAIETLSPELLDEIFPDSKYKPLMFKDSYNWHFSKSEPYMHYFIEHYKRLVELSSNDSYFLKSEIKNAIDIFKKLDDSGIVFDTNSDSSHLPIWQTALNMWDKIDREQI